MLYRKILGLNWSRNPKETFERKKEEVFELGLLIENCPRWKKVVTSNESWFYPNAKTGKTDH